MPIISYEDKKMTIRIRQCRILEFCRAKELLIISSVAKKKSEIIWLYSTKALSLQTKTIINTEFMITAVLANGLQYAIPNSDTDFFKNLARRMGWTLYKADTQEAQETEVMPVSWVDEFVGKWQDTRPTEQILQDIHSARTSNDDIAL